MTIAITQAPHDEPQPRAVAWAIHALTASGAVLAFFSFLAVEAGNYRLALWWLAAALVVDGVDGPLARWAGIANRMPAIDGATLDLVVDYLTYVFVPAVLIYRAGLLPEGWSAVGVAAILLSSLYTFARTDMKTSDNFFRGFPAVWNVVAFYLFFLEAAADGEPCHCRAVRGADLRAHPFHSSRARARIPAVKLGVLTGDFGARRALRCFGMDGRHSGRKSGSRFPSRAVRHCWESGCCGRCGDRPAHSHIGRRRLHAQSSTQIL